MPSQSYIWFSGTSPCELGQCCGGIYKLQWKKCLLRHTCQEQKYLYVVRYISYLIGSGSVFICDFIRIFNVIKFCIVSA